MKSKYFLENKKAEMTTIEIVKIILAVIGIGILLYLLVSMYGLVGKRNKDQQILDGLNNILDVGVKSVGIDTPSNDYLLLYGKGRYLASFEYYDGIPECNTFCLCFCDFDDCSGNKICKETAKFILLRDLNGNEARTLWIKDAPTGFNLTYLDYEVYPYNAGKPFVEDYSYAVYEGGEVVMIPMKTIFYEFDDRWYWTLDFDYWMPTSENKNFKGAEGKIVEVLSLPNQEFIGRLNFLSEKGTDEESGFILFGTVPTRKSYGVVAMQMQGGSS